jgi:transcriptional regulator NrdR family protein
MEKKMKCPVCNAPTDVEETRTKDDHTYRRRECFNEHTFTTEERVKRVVTGGATQVVALHTPRPKKVPKSG